jgi:hypothetical protein
MSVVSDDENVEDVKIVPTPGVFWVPSQSKFSAWQYIVVNKERQKLDGPIQEMDVVRPINHMFTVKDVDNPDEWNRKSSMCCPTYGNCSSCGRSGPAGMACAFCNDRDAGYMCYYIGKKGGRQWIDAQWLAVKLFREGHVTAMANRRVGWLSAPIKFLSLSTTGWWIINSYPRAEGESKAEIEPTSTEYCWSLWIEINSGWSSVPKWWLNGHEDVDEDE